MLKQLTLAVFAVAAALSASAWAQGRLDRDAIDVQVVNGQILVEEEEARTTPEHGALVWRVVTPGYRFADDGIVIQSDGKHRCGSTANGQRYRCAKLRHLRGERYKYDVRLVNARPSSDSDSDSGPAPACCARA